MMPDSRIGELAAKVEKLAKTLFSVSRENARLRRLLLAAENKIRELSSGGVPNGEGSSIMEITKQLEKFKQERKAIREKVERMATALDKFYHE